MSKSQRKLQKERARQKTVKTKLRKRREVQRSLAREEREELRAQRKFEKEQEEIMKWEEAMEKAYAKLPPETRKQLLHNIEILKALEEEHKQELAAKRELNESLESEGYVTPESKMQALQEQALAQVEAEEKQIGMGGSADCSFTVNED